MSTVAQSVLSCQYVPVLVKAEAATPTSDTVQMAFVASGDPQSGDWNTASWAAQQNLPTTQGIAQCLVGPGGTIALATGTYTIWVKVTDSPEVPVQVAGLLTIF